MNGSFYENKEMAKGSERFRIRLTKLEIMISLPIWMFNFNTGALISKRVVIVHIVSHATSYIFA